MSAEEVIVTLPNGQIRGRTEVTYSNVTFYAFDEIPYGEPPLGKLRFMVPQPAKNWTGILDCTTNTKICRQMNKYNSMENEDCLYLNVYTPVKPGSQSSLAVMYYIFGGGFEHGSSTFIGAGPHYFMEYGVVIVSVNYRTGPQGFLSTGDAAILGNMGLKDQLLGLKWVQQNIHLFGGDPEKVTIFGQSAGGASVTYQILSKQSSDATETLYSARPLIIAWAMRELMHWQKKRHARDIAYQFATRINSSFDVNQSSEQLLQFLQSVPEEDLAAAANGFKPTGINQDESVQGFFFSPVIEVEHDEAFITENQYTLLEKGDFNKVPLIIGICSEESIGRASNLTNFEKTVTEFEEDVTNFVNEDMHIIDENNKTLAGEEIKKIYTDGQLASNLSTAVRFYSDTSFTRPIIRYAEMQSAYTDVYFYQFSYFGNMTSKEYIYLPGAGAVPHAGDWSFQWAKNNKSNINIYPTNDILTHDRYMGFFTNFSKYLNPTPTQSSLDGQSDVWPRLTQNFFYLDIDTELSIKLNPRSESYAKWVEVYKTWGVPPFDTY
ncbi:hypothetical protein NQ318_015706 [Aromia moschata]|uniref:Carboxylic ester hydrolase n=1 Tax=Aromia moschata TaxID=1265417 RepID=A0AAV8YIB2_9CUCU|nr:hypothetical protein NQ318_015706 [Aromia moschata]